MSKLLTAEQKASRIIFGDETSNLRAILRRANLENKYSTYANYKKRTSGMMPLQGFAKVCKARKLTDMEILSAVKAFY